MTDDSRFERIIGVLLRAGVTLSSMSLLAGLVLALYEGDANGPVTRAFLNGGILILLATPAARVVASVIQYLSERDWVFFSLTAIVLAELLASVVEAMR
jgi:uncharacterized membrane protein